MEVDYSADDVDEALQYLVNESEDPDYDRRADLTRALDALPFPGKLVCVMHAAGHSYAQIAFEVYQDTQARQTGKRLVEQFLPALRKEMNGGTYSPTRRAAGRED